LGQTKGYEIGIRCFFAKQVALRSEDKPWMALNQDKVEQHVYPVSYHYKNPPKCVGLEQIEHHHLLIDKELVLAMILLKNYSLALNNYDSLTQCMTSCYFEVSKLLSQQITINSVLSIHFIG
jgi:hypothetical protein